MTTTNSTPTNTSSQDSIVVRDHRKPVAIVRDHTGTGVDASQYSGGVVATASPIVRDHRDSAKEPTKRPTTYGSGGSGGVLDTLGDAVSGVGHAVGSVGGAIGDAVTSAGNAVGIGYGTITPAGGTTTKRPTWKPATEGTIVRDHRK